MGEEDWQEILCFLWAQSLQYRSGDFLLCLSVSLCGGSTLPRRFRTMREMKESIARTLAFFLVVLSIIAFAFFVSQVIGQIVAYIAGG